MDREENERLIDEFRHYLASSPDKMQSRPHLNVSSFYQELIGLKNEVKIESRQVKKGLDEFREATNRIKAGNREIAALLADTRSSTKPEESTDAIPHPLAISLLDIYDRLASGGHAGAMEKPSFLSQFFSKERKIITAMREAQQMTLQRFEKLLNEYDITPTKTIAQKFSPHTMRAVGNDSNTQLQDGIVTGEIRKGFMWNDEVLRLADVKVNRNTEK